MARQLDFTRGPIVGPLIRFSVPIMAAHFLQALYGAVDLWVVGRFAQPADVSGVSVGSMLMATITYVIVSLSMGTTIFLGQKIGERDARAGGDIIGTSIVLFLSIGGVLTLLIPLLSGALASLMNAPEGAFDTTRQYILITGAGSLMIIAYNLLGSIMRGMGDSQTPLVTVAIASAINIAGDLLLVAGLHMGAAGAAIATVCAQSFSVLISFLLLRRRELPFRFGRENLRLKGEIVRRILRFGIPIATSEFLVSLSFLVIAAIVNQLGVVASAGMGVAEKVCGFIMLIPGAFMQAMSAYVAQNKGAGEYGRALRGLWLAVGLSTAFGVVMFLLSFFRGNLLCAVFSGDPEVVAAGFDYLKAYAIDCLFTCFLFCFVGFYNGLGHTGFVMMQGIVSAFAIRIPVSWFMARTTGRLFYIGLGIPMSTIAEIIACFVFFSYLRRKELRPARENS